MDEIDVMRFCLKTKWQSTVGLSKEEALKIIEIQGLHLIWFEEDENDEDNLIIRFNQPYFYL